MPGTARFSIALLLCRWGSPERTKAWTVEPALEFLGRGQKEPGGGELCQVGWSVVEAPGDVSVQRMLGVKLSAAGAAAVLEQGAQNRREESRSFALH